MSKAYCGCGRVAYATGSSERLHYDTSNATRRARRRLMPLSNISRFSPRKRARSSPVNLRVVPSAVEETRRFYGRIKVKIGSRRSQKNVMNLLISMHPPLLRQHLELEGRHWWFVARSRT